MPWDLDKLAEFQTEASYNEIILGHGFEVILSHDPLFSFVTPHSSYISPFFIFYSSSRSATMPSTPFTTPERSWWRILTR